MREIRKKVVTEQTRYIAVDGTEFSTQSECKVYEDIVEKSTICQKWAAIPKACWDCADELIPHTSQDDLLYLVKIRSEKDLESIEAYLDEVIKDSLSISKSYIGKDVLLVVSEDYCYADFLGTIEEYLAAVALNFGRLDEMLNAPKTNGN